MNNMISKYRYLPDNYYGGVYTKVVDPDNLTDHVAVLARAGESSKFKLSLIHI